ncbi:MAG: Ig-like domain-containing protein [Akkermansiaceae bacterium]
MKNNTLSRALALALIGTLAPLGQINAETTVGLRNLSPGSYAGGAETTSPRTFNSTTDSGSLSSVAWSDGGYSGVVDISFVATTSGSDNIRRGSAGAFGIKGGTDTLIDAADGTITLSDIVFTYVSGDTLDKIATINFAAVYIGNWTAGETGTLNGTALTTGDSGGTTTATGRNELGTQASSVVVDSTNGAFSINGVDIAVTAIAPGTINWGAATDVSAASDVVTTGTLVEAFNAGLNGVANRTVNGVTFIGTGSLLDQNSSISAYTGPTTGDAAYDAMLNDLDYGGGTDTVSLQVGGGNLQVGVEYLIQVWYADTRIPSRNTPVGDGAATPNTVSLSASGQYATGTFTAGGTTQTITLESPGFGNAHITAYQVRTVSSAPLPTLTTAADPVSAPFTVNVGFTEAMTGLEESDFSVTNGTVTASSLSGSGTAYTVEITPGSTGDVTVSLPENSVTDTDGDNNQNPASNLLTVLYIAPGSDQPTVALSTPSSNVTNFYTVTATFSEAVTGLALADFDVTNGTASGLTGSGSTYSILITPAAEGDVTVLLPADVATDTDDDNLPNAASTSLVTTYSIPTVPTVQLHGILTSASPSFDVYISFSEEITGLTDSDFQVLNGSASGTVSTSAGTLDTHLNPLQGRFYKTTITAASPGSVEITLPAGVVTDTDGDNDTNLLSNTYITNCTSDFGDKWIIDDQADWTAATSSTSNMTITDGMVEPTANSAQFTSNAINFPVKRKATFLTLEQSPVWDNWTNAGNVSPSGAGDAPILVSVANDNYYFLARSGSVYHAWHSTDMVNWTHKGPVTSGSGGRWTTSAEYKDGEFYIYSDDPNDHNPRLFKDADLDDGVAGTDMGLAFVKDASGSDTGVIRSDETGLFHFISEDWTPLNASTHAWDSPLASHTSSADGLNGFTAHEHHPPIDLRTTSTGTFATFNHPNKANVLYEIHTPEQDAFGDWTAIKIGSRYYMFADYDPAGQSIRLAKFTSDSIYKEFDLLGQVETHSGHPDPTCGFAEGQFYLITQQSTDWVSPGPWVAGVEARAGVDTDGDTVIDQWTDWDIVTESYDHKAGYIRVVEKTPAQLDLSSLPAGYNFEFEFRVDNTEVPDTAPIMDRVEMAFEPSHFQQWANTASTPATVDGDHNDNGIANGFEFAVGLTDLSTLQPDGNGLLSLTMSKDAIDDGFALILEYSENLNGWTEATGLTTPVKLLSSVTQPNGDLKLEFEFDENFNQNLFWRLNIE